MIRNRSLEIFGKTYASFIWIESMKRCARESDENCLETRSMLQLETQGCTCHVSATNPKLPAQALRLAPTITHFGEDPQLRGGWLDMDGSRLEGRNQLRK